MKIDGGCHCGGITYEAEVEPDKVIICHCTDCQSLSGSAFRTVVFTVEDGFTLLSGTPQVYVKLADSGRRREQTFCGDCGSPICSADVGDGPKVYGIRLGTARQRDRLAPKSQYWCRSARDWTDAIGTLPRIAEQAR